MLQKNVDYKVQGYTGRWSLVDQVEGYGLLENNTWGDETFYLVVKMDQDPAMKRYKNKDDEVVKLPTIREVICETYDGLEVALEDEGIMVDGKIVGADAGMLDQVEGYGLLENNASSKGYAYAVASGSWLVIRMVAAGLRSKRHSG